MRTYYKTLLQISCQIMLLSEVIFKSNINPDENFSNGLDSIVESMTGQLPR